MKTKCQNSLFLKYKHTTRKNNKFVLCEIDSKIRPSWKSGLVVLVEGDWWR